MYQQALLLHLSHSKPLADSLLVARPVGSRLTESRCKNPCPKLEINFLLRRKFELHACDSTCICMNITPTARHGAKFNSIIVHHISLVYLLYAVIGHSIVTIICMSLKLATKQEGYLKFCYIHVDGRVPCPAHIQWMMNMTKLKILRDPVMNKQGSLWSHVVMLGQGFLHANREPTDRATSRESASGLEWLRCSNRAYWYIILAAVLTLHSNYNWL